MLNEPTGCLSAGESSMPAQWPVAESNGDDTLQWGRGETAAEGNSINPDLAWAKKVATPRSDRLVKAVLRGAQIAF